MKNGTAGRAGNATPTAYQYAVDCADWIEGLASTKAERTFAAYVAEHIRQDLPSLAPKAAPTTDDGAELVSLVTPVPGAEAVYADFLARVGDGSRKMETGRKRQPRKCRPMKFKYPTGDRYGHGDWLPASVNPHTIRVSVPAGEHDDDYLWRQRFPTLDRFLAHCEVAGRVLRRYATAGGYGQRLELPVRPGSLEVGEVLELTADEIRFQCCELAGSVWPGVPATSAA